MIRDRVVKAPKALTLYTITYLCRVETDHVELYTNKGLLSHAIRKTKLIERDCFVLALNIPEAVREIEDIDTCFVRMLKVTVIPPRTVVHILDRATNYIDKV